MSEVGVQLVENGHKRDDCRAHAQRIAREVIAGLRCGDDEAVAGLDDVALATALQRLAACKYIMRNLLAERATLAAQA